MRPFIFTILSGLFLTGSPAAADDDVKQAATLARQLDRVPESTLDSSGLSLDTYIRAYTMLQKASKILGDEKSMAELSRIVRHIHSSILKEGGVRVPVIKIIEDGIKMALMSTTYNDKTNRAELTDLYATYSFSIIKNEKRHAISPVDLAAFHEAAVSDLMRIFSQSQGTSFQETLEKLGAGTSTAK